MAPPVYIKGAELPDVAVTWTDELSGLIDFTTGWTFTAFIGHVNEVAEITKVTGITGSGTPPNVVVAWAPGEFDALPPGTYDVDLQAHHTASNKDRKRRFQITIEERVEP